MYLKDTLITPRIVYAQGSELQKLPNGEWERFDSELSIHSKRTLYV